MKNKVLGIAVFLLAVAMLATPVMAIGPQNSENNPNVFFPVYGVGLDAPSGIHHEWVNAAPVPIHIMWIDARDFKRRNVIVVDSTSEAAEIENKWMYFSMELWATWLYEKIPMLPYPVWLAWAMANTPEGVYFHQVFVGK
ncbi:hypothetical protein JXA31_06605 [Candidatus Bathyarchaeota archaeon]|nr:hypothetical protein [Candidatus Bathyarchaeota archaeon]